MPAEIDKLLDSDVNEVRAGALSIMDKQARRKRTSEERRREPYEPYRRRFDRINNWDLVAAEKLSQAEGAGTARCADLALLRCASAATRWRLVERDRRLDVRAAA